MSAATRDGVDEVIAYTSQLLQEVEDIELVSEEEYYRPELDNTVEEGLSVEIDEDGTYVVTGKNLEESCTLLTLRIWNLSNSSKNYGK